MDLLRDLDFFIAVKGRDKYKANTSCFIHLPNNNMDKSSQELEVVKQSIREAIPYIRGKKIRPSPEAIFKLLKKNFHLELQTFKEALSELEYDEEITNKGKDGKISYFLKEFLKTQAKMNLYIVKVRLLI